MQCQICNKNEATIHLTEINEGQRSELHICEKCALEQGIAVKSHMPVNELLSNLLASQPSEEEDFRQSEKAKSCPVCGFSLDDLRKEALLGCPHDYTVFEKSLSPIIEKAHDGNSTHTGKVPSRTPEDSRKQMELLNLRQELEQAVQAEDYERAAGIRDRIAELE